MKFQITLFSILAVVSNVLSGCDYPPCGSEPHTMCQYPATLDKTGQCSNPESFAGLNQAYRKAILDKHNYLRNKVATGEAGQPPAANMMKLRWDMEVETIAQRFVNSCPQVGHDTCRNLKDGTQVGQNSGNNVINYKNNPNRTAAVENVVEMWYGEINNMNPAFIDDFSTAMSSFGQIGHYTQLVWAETTRVGCGYLEYNYQSDTFQYILLDCDYAVSGNLMNRGTKIYIEGEPCSQCPQGTHCSKRYAGLCTAEVDEDIDVGLLQVKEVVGGKDGKEKNVSGEGSPSAGATMWSVFTAVILVYFLGNTL